MRKSLSIIAVLALAVASIVPAPAAYANCQTLEFITESIPGFYQLEEVNFQIEVYGGTPGYTFAITSGSLPSGLHLTSSGVIEGEPDGDPGYTTIWVRVTDSMGCQKTSAYEVYIWE